MEEMEIEFRVPVTKIKNIQKCPNSDNLEICTVFGFNVVTRSGSFQNGSTVIYIPIDSILPQQLEERIFGPDSKIKLHKSRVRQIKIRGAVSQGMLLSPSLVPELKNLEEDDNVAEKLGIIKYEPPNHYNASPYNGPKLRNRPKENPYFHKYGGIQNFKWYPDLFVEGQEVIYQEKIHGSNFRFGLLPYIPSNWWEKLKNYFGWLPKYQFTYGSNNVQLQKRKGNKGYYGTDVYGAACEKYDIKSKLQPHEIVYAELYGPGIQKNYDYGLKEHAIAVFDVKVLAADKQSTRWLTVDEVFQFCVERKLPMVPILYRGPHSMETAKEYTEGTSYLGGKDVKEGIVIRDPIETSSYMGKKWLKLISEDYLDNKDNTDNH